MRTPPPSDETHPVDRAAASAVIAAALTAGRQVLSEQEGKALLFAYGIPVVETSIAGTPDEAAAIASVLLLTCGSVVLKILSDDISHKSDVGGVRIHALAEGKYGSGPSSPAAALAETPFK